MNAREWTSWPVHHVLIAAYPILYLDALQVKIRDGAHVVNKAIYLAIGITLSGTREVLGLWLQQTEGVRVLAPDRGRAQQPRGPRCLHRLR